MSRAEQGRVHANAYSHTHTHTLENRMCIVYARHTEPRHQQNPKREKSSTLTTDNKTNPKNHGDYIYDYTCEWSTVVWIV